VEVPKKEEIPVIEEKPIAPKVNNFVKKAKKVTTPVSTEKQIDLQNKFAEIAESIKATYAEKSGNKVQLKTTIEQLKEKNATRRVERAARFESRLTELKAAQEERNAKLKERLESEFNPPALKKDDIFEKALTVTKKAIEKRKEETEKRQEERKKTRKIYKEPMIQKVFGDMSTPKKETEAEAVKNENDKNMKNEKAAEAAAIANQTPDSGILV